MTADIYAFPMNVPDADPSQPCRILLLEEDDQLRAKLVGDLVLAGWDVLHASNTNDALVAWVGSATPVDLLVLNPSAGDGDALRLWRHLTALQSGLQVLVLIAGPARHGWTAVSEPAAAATSEELVREVRRLLAP